jgi:hypothetical protein
MAIKSKRSSQGTQNVSGAQYQRAWARAKRIKMPVLISYWFEGWEGHERRVNLYVKPNGDTQEKRWYSHTPARFGGPSINRSNHEIRNTRRSNGPKF